MFGWVETFLSFLLDTDTVFSARITAKAESLLQDLEALCK